MEKALLWIGGIFAVIGLIIIFYDVITSVKSRNKFKTNVVGLVLLTIAVVGYFTTDVIAVISAWPAFASLVWIALFWAYVVISIVVAVDQSKKQRHTNEVAVAVAEEQQTPKADETTAVQVASNKSVKTQQKGKNKNSQKKQVRKVVIVKKGYYSNKK